MTDNNIDRKIRKKRDFNQSKFLYVAEMYFQQSSVEIIKGYIPVLNGVYSKLKTGPAKRSQFTFLISI